MIDAILANLPPTGTKPFKDGFRSVRLVEFLPVGPAERSPVPAEETRHFEPNATTSSLGSHGPSRILAELDLEADGSFQIDLPAPIAFRMQGLDERGMSLGVPHNRWFDLREGQTIKQGVSHQKPRIYAARCSPCHGAANGDPAQVFIEPDVMTMATVTLARFENADPRLPKRAPVADETSRVEVDFRRDIQPILDRSCVDGCHTEVDPAAGLSLSNTPTTWYTDAYESLLAPGSESGNGRRYVDDSDGRAASSFLIETLLGEELEAPGSLGVNPVAHPADALLNDEELEYLIRWIELGATFVGSLE